MHCILKVDLFKILVLITVIWSAHLLNFLFIYSTDDICNSSVCVWFGMVGGPCFCVDRSELYFVCLKIVSRGFFQQSYTVHI